MAWKEKNRRAFKRVEEEADRVRDRWYHILGCLVISNLFFSIEDFGKLTETLMDVQIFFTQVGILLVPIVNKYTYTFYLKKTVPYMSVFNFLYFIKRT